MSTPTPHATAAVNRFGLGAKPGELQRVDEPRKWLLAQVTRGPDGGDAFAGLPNSLEYLSQQTRLRMQRRQLKDHGKGRDKDRGPRSAVPKGTPQATEEATAQLKRIMHDYRSHGRKQLLAEVASRYQVSNTSDTPFVERLVHFWSNHFAVSVDKPQVRMLAAPMEREAIRPHVTGRFADMLLAVETHPAMLLYLDNMLSVGPDSRVGKHYAARARRRGAKATGKIGGLNENLGREIMELHTLGVNGGYSQADVTELSRALTGWSVPLARDFRGFRQPHSAFLYRAAAHQPGTRQIMGKTFADNGLDQGKSMLAWLARQTATATHLAHKLAQHFVADQPPAALVKRLAKAYLDHDTDLAHVYRTLIDSPEAWGAGARKFRTPQDFLIATLRAGQIQLDDRPQSALGLLMNLGEPWFEPRSPEGFSDLAVDWIDAEALWKRVQAAEALASRVAASGDKPTTYARDILGPLLDQDTEQAVHRAESIRQAHAIVFACPTFQWRV